MLEKTQACLVHQNYDIDFFFTSTTHRYLLPCVLQRCSHYHIKETTNIQSKNLEALNNNFLLGLKVWLSKNRFEPICSSSTENPSKITLHGNWNCSAPKTEHSSPRWHIKDNGHTYIFEKKSFFYFRSCLSTGKG